MKILVTGGTGYIGSHTVVELIEAGHYVVIVDNLSNSSDVVLDRIKEITGRKPGFYKIDVCSDDLEDVFKESKFDAVIHFAALKAVGESVSKPVEYYRNNLGGLLNILELIKKYAVKQFIFSSSATVYGEPEEVPLKETSRVGAGITNPYGQTKFIGEQILKDFAKANPDFSITLLRYFNPIGAHKSGLIGEDPNDIPNNLLPFVSQVAVGKLPELSVFGDDYPTKDGTGVRDYIHVVDLAKAHLAALSHTANSENVDIYNLGTGRGYSVLEIITAFEKVSDKKVPYKVVARREGDIAKCYADPAKAEKQLGWKAEKNLEDMCRDAWNWQSKNPGGYQS